MPQVSKNELEKELEKLLQKNFYRSFVGLKSEKEAKEFLNDLLTPTEKIMLAKRMGITRLLLSRLKYRKISGVLKVSYATVSKIQNKSRDREESVFQRTLNKKHWEAFVTRAKALLPYSKLPDED